MSAQFQEDLARGKIGETLVIECLRGRGHEVEDVSDNPAYWEKDIDLICSGKTVEVKYDTNINRTKNMFLERDVFYKKDRKSKDGWFYYTQAEYLFYVNATIAEVYIFYMEDLRKYVKENLYSGFISIGTCFDSYKETKGFLVKPQYIPHQTIKLKGE